MSGQSKTIVQLQERLLILGRCLLALHFDPDDWPVGLPGIVPPDGLVPLPVWRALCVDSCAVSRFVASRPGAQKKALECYKACLHPNTAARRMKAAMLQTDWSSSRSPVVTESQSLSLGDIIDSATYKFVYAYVADWEAPSVDTRPSPAQGKRVNRKHPIRFICGLHDASTFISLPDGDVGLRFVFCVFPEVLFDCSSSMEQNLACS